MEEIKKIINEIRTVDKDWERYNSIKEIDGAQIEKPVNMLIEAIRNIIKEGRADELKGLQESIRNPQLCDDLIAFSHYTLKHYMSWKIVRELEKTNKELVPVLFQSIMEKFVLRLEFEFQQTYHIYQVKDEDVFYELLKSYDTLTSFYVQRHLSRKSIVQDIIEETEINNDDAELFADLIERNYKELQINIIIDNLANMQL